MRNSVWLGCLAFATGWLVLHLATEPADWPFMLSSMAVAFVALFLIRRSAISRDPEKARWVPLHGELGEPEALPAEPPVRRRPVGVGLVMVLFAGLAATYIVGFTLLTLSGRGPAAHRPAAESREVGR